MISAKDAHDKAVKANENIVTNTIELFEKEIRGRMEDGYFSYTNDVHNDLVRKAVTKHFRKLGYKVKTTFWYTVSVYW